MDGTGGTADELVRTCKEHLRFFTREWDRKVAESQEGAQSRDMTSVDHSLKASAFYQWVKAKCPSKIIVEAADSEAPPSSSINYSSFLPKVQVAVERTQQVGEAQQGKEESKKRKRLDEDVDLTCFPSSADQGHFGKKRKEWSFNNVFKGAYSSDVYPGGFQPGLSNLERIVIFIEHAVYSHRSTLVSLTPAGVATGLYRDFSIAWRRTSVELLRHYSRELRQKLSQRFRGSEFCDKLAQKEPIRKMNVKEQQDFDSIVSGVKKLELRGEGSTKKGNKEVEVLKTMLTRKRSSTGKRHPDGCLEKHSPLYAFKDGDLSVCPSPSPSNPFTAMLTNAT